MNPLSCFSVDRLQSRLRTGRGRQSKSWEDWAQADPYYAVLSDPARWDGSWASDSAEFFSSGRAEVQAFLQQCQDHDLPVTWDKALDFGCGLGRVTHTLAARCEQVLGVDVSPTMVSEATRLHANVENMAFHCIGEVADLSGETFDLIWSVLVLQHMGSSAAIQKAMASLCSMLNVSGTMLIEIPHSIPSASWRGRLRLRTRLFGLLRAVSMPPDFLKRRLGLCPSMTMHAVPESDVIAMLKAAYLEVIQIRGYDGIDGVSYRRYLARRSRG